MVPADDGVLLPGLAMGLAFAGVLAGMAPCDCLGVGESGTNIGTGPSDCNGVACDLNHSVISSLVISRAGPTDDDDTLPA